MMKLITEMNEDTSVLVEDVNGKKSMFIEGIFLQGNIKNRNGRIYPDNILEKEVARYNENYIAKSRALGELNHPCFKGDAEILTTDGWKSFNTLTGDENVYTRNSNNILEINTISKLVINDFDDYMYNMKNRLFNTTVTPAHRFLIINFRTKEEKFVTADDINNHIMGIKPLSKKNNNKWYIPKRSFGLKVNDHDTYTIKGSTSLKVVKKNFKFLLDDISFDLKVFCGFLGLYLAEGCTTYLKNKNSYKIQLFQNEGDKSDIIRELLEKMDGLSWSEYVVDNKITWSCHDRRLGEYLHVLGNCYNKYVPSDIIKMMDIDTATEFLTFFILGDGRGYLNKKYVQCDMFSVSEELIDNCCHILSIAGYASNKIVEITENDYFFADRIIEAKNKKPLYFAKVISSQGIYIDNRHLNIQKEFYSGKVYCIQVKNETFIARENGYSFWSGNCGPNINLDKVSHNIISLKKENNSSNYIGKAKLLEGTPNGDTAISLIKQGVCLAVSSRGLGSLKENKIGIMEVQDDFYLATAADIVADPSAPDAFVNGIMEGMDFFWTEGGSLQATKAEQIYEEIVDEIENAINHRELAEQKAILFNKFLQKLNTINR